MKFFAYMLLLFSLTAFADDDCRGNNDCSDSSVNVDASNTVDSSVSNSMSNSSRSMGFGLGDVDIAQCYRSYQFLVWQDTKINPVCLADSYDAKGLHHMAAVIRCDVKHIRKHFDSDEACVQANTVRRVEFPDPPISFMEELVEQEVAERTVQMQQQQAYISDLESRLNRMEQSNKAAARTAAQKRQEEREYAQQLLKELEDYR